MLSFEVHNVSLRLWNVKRTAIMTVQKTRDFRNVKLRSFELTQIFNYLKKRIFSPLAAMKAPWNGERILPGGNAGCLTVMPRPIMFNWFGLRTSPGHSRTNMWPHERTVQICAELPGPNYTVRREKALRVMDVLTHRASHVQQRDRHWLVSTHKPVL